MTKARLVSLDSKESSIDLDVVHPATAERLKRAMKPFGIFFLIGICTLPIPFVHLFAPVLSLLAGISLGIKTFLETQLIRSAQAPCPVCSAAVNFKNVPLHKINKTVCSSCRNQLRLIIT